MMLPYRIARWLAVLGTALFVGLGIGGFGALAGLNEAPHWLGPATALALAFGGLCAAAWGRLQAFARFPFRTVSARQSVTLRSAPSRIDGTPVATGIVRSETEIETVCPGQTAVRLQKFVTEPPGIDAERMLAEWSYECGIAGGRGGVTVVAPQPYLSSSRSLQLDLALPVPAKAGERFTVVENLSFEFGLDEPARFVFQPSYPALRQTVEIRFEDLRVLSAQYRIDRGLGISESGSLQFKDGRIGLTWNRAEPGEQLIIDWTWDPASLPTPLTETERLIAAAKMRQAEVEKILAIQFANEESEISVVETWRQPMSPPLSGDSGFADDAPADEHPIIQAARAREKLYKGEE